MDNDTIKDLMKRAAASYTGPVHQCPPGVATVQEKKRPPSHSGEERRVRRNAEKHGYRVHKRRGISSFTLIGIHDRIVLENTTLEEVDAFLGGPPPNAYSLKDFGAEETGKGS